MARSMEPRGRPVIVVVELVLCLRTLHLLLAGAAQLTSSLACPELHRGLDGQRSSVELLADHGGYRRRDRGLWGCPRHPGTPTRYVANDALSEGHHLLPFGARVLRTQTRFASLDDDLTTFCGVHRAGGHPMAQEQ